MKFTLIGGDGRMLRLMQQLRQDGHTVSPYAMEKAADCTAAPDFEGADAVILPLPAEKNSALFAPFSPKEQQIPTLFDHIPQNMPVLAGRASPALASLCREKSLRLYDYFRREDFTLTNALLTAEGAVQLLMGAGEGALLGSRVVIYGFGRIGKALARRLIGLEAKVTVCARNPAARMEARAMGCRDEDFSARPEADFAVNTVPFPHLSAEEFPKAVCLELASPPYGFPSGSIGREVLDGSALPGRYAPESAARAIKDAIYNVLKEEKLWKN